MSVGVTALAQQQSTISAITQPNGRNQRSVNIYVRSERQPGGRWPSRPVAVTNCEEYFRIPLCDDPCVWDTILHDEVVKIDCEHHSQIRPPGPRRRG
jgi:hypothetical protein